MGNIILLLLRETQRAESSLCVTAEVSQIESYIYIYIIYKRLSHFKSVIFFIIYYLFFY